MTVDAAPPQPTDELAPPKSAGLPKLLKPYFYITGYYAVAGVLIAAVLMTSPRVLEVLPVGGATNIGEIGQAAFEPANRELAPTQSTLREGIHLSLAIIGAFLLMLPVTWICMGARRRKDVTQSFIQTILVLPMIITGIVHVVHDSLALAFSLAGIVAGVRFRHTLKDSAEASYLFTAIAVGIACGINAVEVAGIISIFFNYTVLGLWATEYGADSTGKQMFSREWMAKEEAKEKEKKRDERRDDDDDD